MRLASICCRTETAFAALLQLRNGPAAEFLMLTPLHCRHPIHARQPGRGAGRGCGGAGRPGRAAGALVGRPRVRRAPRRVQAQRRGAAAAGRRGRLCRRPRQLVARGPAPWVRRTWLAASSVIAHKKGRARSPGERTWQRTMLSALQVTKRQEWSLTESRRCCSVQSCGAESWAWRGGWPCAWGQSQTPH